MSGKIVTHQEMVDFINAQPDDRLVNFNEVDFDSECGCVMIQYFRDKGFVPLPIPSGVGISEFNDIERHFLERGYMTYRPNIKDKYSIFTYKEMKAHVNG